MPCWPPLCTLSSNAGSTRTYEDSEDDNDSKESNECPSSVSLSSLVSLVSPRSMPSLLDRLDLSTALTAAMTNAADHPLTTIVQVSLTTISVLFVFLILYTTRDILLRSRSLTAQIASVLLVSLLPLVGFLLYLLLRPARTISERALDADIRELRLSTATIDQRLTTLTKTKRWGKDLRTPPRVFEVTVKKGEKVKGSARRVPPEELPLPT